MFFKKKKNPNRFYKSFPKKYKWNRWDFLLSLLLAGLVLFSLSIAQRWGKEPSALAKGPESGLPEVMRVQILNACGVSRLAEAVVKKIAVGNPSPGYFYDIVDKANFDVFDIRESFVAYRDDGFKEAAKELAHLLGIPDERIVQEAFANNFLELDLKVVVGEDFQPPNQRSKSKKV